MPGVTTRKVDTPEEWRPVAGFPDYEVSSLGRVASVKRGERQILRGGKTDTGYRNVLLYRDGVRVGRRIHQLVAHAFLGPRPEGLQIRHLDGDQLNNEARNLLYGTQAENMADRRRHAGRLLIVDDKAEARWLRAQRRAGKGLDPLAPLPRARTHCRRGHLRSAENTYVYPNGYQSCRPCKTAFESESRRRRAFRAAGVAA